MICLRPGKDSLCSRCIHAFNGEKLFKRGGADRFETAEMPDERFAPCRANARDILELRMGKGVSAQRAVMGDRRAVRLVTNALNQLKLGSVMVKAYRFLLIGKIDFFFFFGQAEHRDIHTQSQNGLPRKSNLLRAAVDENEIREIAELAAFCRKPGCFTLQLFLQTV